MADTPLIDAGLLDLLLHAREPMSVESLALAGGISRADVLARVARLREAGCRFDEHPQQGLRLIEAGLGTWADYLHFHRRRESRIEIYRESASTQDLARRLVTACGRASDGAIVVAARQTAGRGRLGRTWHAPPGSAITFSRVAMLAPAQRGGAVDRLSLAAAVAVAEAAEHLLPAGADVRIKWPNDVVIGGRKLAGVLVETSPAAEGLAAIVGVGLNVHLRPGDLPADDPALRGRVTSLAMAGAAVDRLEALAEVASRLDEAIERMSAEEVHARWRQRSLLLYRQVSFQSGGRPVEGEVIDADPEAGLIVRTASGQIVHLPAAGTTVLGGGGGRS